jgi:hypothetical protein
MVSDPDGLLQVVRQKAEVFRPVIDAEMINPRSTRPKIHLILDGLLTLDEHRQFMSSVEDIPADVAIDRPPPDD